MEASQAETDRRNAQFWNELCGTTLARQVGATDGSTDSLRRFDRAYLQMYPYLDRYLPGRVSGRRVLEIGLGFGTVGQLLAERGADYVGVDLAEGPVAMMRERLRHAGLDDPTRRVVQASALALPFEAETFDHVISIGCLHHTGDLRRAVTEVHRVLAPGGRALVMVYNGRSLRRLWGRLRSGWGRDDEAARAAYDVDSKGRAAPTTQFVSRRRARELFGDFKHVLAWTPPPR